MPATEIVNSRCAADTEDSLLARPASADLSVIVVNWNTRELLLQCLRSITAQTGAYDSEIIVVDNFSSDGSVDAVRTEFPDLRLIVNERNLGFAKANNLALRQCRGQYAFLINSDVVLRDRCIPSLYDYMKEHPSIGVLGPRILNGDLTLQESCKEFPTIWNSVCRAVALDTAFPNCRLFSSQLMRYWAHDDIRPVDILSGCFWTVRRDALRVVGLLDEEFFMYAEDKDWCMRFWKAGWQVVYYPAAEAIHLAGASSSRDPIRFYVEMNRANLRYWKKHYGRLQQYAIRAVMLLHHGLRVLGMGVVYVVRPSLRQFVVPRLQRSLAVMRSLLFEDSVSVQH